MDRCYYGNSGSGVVIDAVASSVSGVTPNLWPDRAGRRVNGHPAANDRLGPSWAGERSKMIAWPIKGLGAPVGNVVSFFIGDAPKSRPDRAGTRVDGHPAPNGRLGPSWAGVSPHQAIATSPLTIFFIIVTGLRVPKWSV